MYKEYIVRVIKAQRITLYNNPRKSKRYAIEDIRRILKTMFKDESRKLVEPTEVQQKQ